MVHFHAFVKAYQVSELNKPLFRILCLQLSSPSAATNDANIIDMVGGAIRPRNRNKAKDPDKAMFSKLRCVADAIDGASSLVPARLRPHTRRTRAQGVRHQFTSGSWRPFVGSGDADATRVFRRCRVCSATCKQFCLGVCSHSRLLARRNGGYVESKAQSVSGWVAARAGSGLGTILRLRLACVALHVQNDGRWLHGERGWV